MPNCIKGAIRCGNGAAKGPAKIGVKGAKCAKIGVKGAKIGVKGAK